MTDRDAGSGHANSSGQETAQEDVRLMRLVGQGDHDAFRQLVEKHQGPVVGTIAKMLGNASEAEDLAQQVFIRIWKSAARYRPEARFTTWMFTIARNLVFNEIRRRSRRKQVSLEETEETIRHAMPDPDVRPPDEDALQHELWKAIDGAIQALPQKQRLAVVLRRYENLPYEDIAAVLKVSLPAVKSLLFRARTILKQELKVYLDDG